MTYKIGDWKKSTVETLRRLKEENDKGKTPDAAYFHNGSISEWLALLKKEGYVDPGEDRGYTINEKGLALLASLEQNPPVPRSSKRKKKLQKNTLQTQNQLGKNHFMIEITGDKFYLGFEVNIDENKLLKAVSAFKEELENK
jgi:DNA-binding PadR family transcriptional regulator